jgi:hypothetical protein
MKHIMSVLTAFALLVTTVPDTALGHETTHAPEVIGKRARHQIRQHLYRHNLKADKRRIYKELGFTPFRLKIDAGQGQISEQWRYPELGLEFTFNEADKLIKKRHIPRETQG